MSKEIPGTKGLVMNEALLWEKGKRGRIGYSFPAQDVPSHSLNEEYIREDLDLPDLSEVDVVRHYTRLSQWNFGVDTGMYPLGSCTMKYNPKINEKLASLRGFCESHPLLPEQFSQGAFRLMYELQETLGEIVGMDAVSLQPAAGAHGELTGMLLIHAYHKSKGERRTKILIPDTAHGTNPASAALCGFKPIVITSSDQGVVLPEAVAEAMDEDTAGIMLTNPNTLGLFEENIHKIADIVHSKGGQVYCDGANMNAVMGVVDMREMGVDVLHLNLHKTFSTPHGGGGPGSGPVCVQRRLEPFLPVPRIEKKNGKFQLADNYPHAIGRLHSFYGNFGVMIKAYCYILSMGAEGLKRASQLAVLNANYIKEMLRDVLHLPYEKPCMHECVFTDKYQRKHKVSTLDMAKRLIDYGYHPPTIYFPLVVNGAIMIEPTETESKAQIDGFIECFKAIVEEAESNPELLLQAPTNTKVRRLDEVGAARKPCLAE